MNSWLLLNSGRCEPAFNMALDEMLLENAVQTGKPILRFYGWTEPAATFGYFQKFSEVERATQLRPIIRRPTGGGIVPHDADWTYSGIFPPGHEWYLLKAEESYCRIHEWIRDAFTESQIETELAPAKKSAIRNPQSAIPAACFIGHEKFDLLWRGQKIAGAAQRRNQLGLLIQGSIQPPPGLLRAGFEEAMRAAAEKKFGAGWQDFADDDAVRVAAQKLAAEKYARPCYNQRR